MHTIRVLIAEDHRIVRAGVRMLIDSQPDMQVIGETAADVTLINEVKEKKPDVLLLGITLPELNGRNTTFSLRHDFPEVKVLTLTCHSDDFYIHHFLDAGTNGYLLKQSDPTELYRAIRLLADGRSYLDPAITEKVVFNQIAKISGLRGENKADLTSRECEILRLAAFSLSNKEISSRLDISIKTVEAHKHNAMEKLKLRNRGDIVRYGILHGWLQEKWAEEC